MALHEEVRCGGEVREGGVEYVQGQLDSGTVCS